MHLKFRFCFDNFSSLEIFVTCTDTAADVDVVAVAHRCLIFRSARVVPVRKGECEVDDWLDCRKWRQVCTGVALLL